MSVFLCVCVCVGGVMARQDYFTPFDPSKVERKREIPKKKHLTTRKQNLACLTCDPSSQWWDDEQFKAFKISVLNHSATGATKCLFLAKI